MRWIGGKSEEMVMVKKIIEAINSNKSCLPLLSSEKYIAV